MKSVAYPIESHPLKPFLPDGARLLMLGSFPPKRERWSMDFFYPNFQNDMWRIMGHIFYGDKHIFESRNERRFDKDSIVEFCRENGIALYDAACEVRRLKDNASDKFLEIVTATDIAALVAQLPHCGAIVTTGEKATESVAAAIGCEKPLVGAFVEVVFAERKMRFWRMPSSSRAYPMVVEKKADVYRKMLLTEGLLKEKN